MLELKTFERKKDNEKETWRDWVKIYMPMVEKLLIPMEVIG